MAVNDIQNGTMAEVDDVSGDADGLGSELILPLPEPDPEAKRPPVIYSVSPNTSSTNGGARVRITGDNFKSGSTVTFGTFPAVSVTFVNRNTLDCTTPVHPAGNVKIRVTNPSGLMAELARSFTYIQAPAPIIAGLVPNHGPAFGNFGVSVNGANFAPGCQIIFGAGSGPAIYVNQFQVGFTVPPGIPGSFIPVGVRNPDGQLFVANAAFRYDP